MRKMGQMRIPWNILENKGVKVGYPGMLLKNKVVNRFCPNPVDGEEGLPARPASIGKAGLLATGIAASRQFVAKGLD